MYSTTQQPTSTITVEAAGALLRQRHNDTTAKLASLIRHPRSLARPTPTWRPPSVALPALDHSPALRVAIHRRRLGPNIQARVRGFGEHRKPAYVIAARFSSPSGAEAPPALAEAWIRALVGEAHAECVHELQSEITPTFLWMVDAQFQPVHSPASVYAGFAHAA